MNSQYKVYREIGNHPCPCPPILASMMDPFIFLSTPKGFFSVQNARWISLTCMFHHALKKCFNFMVFTFLENALNLWIFTHAPNHQSKLQVECFENLFPPGRKRWRELWFALLKYNQKMSRWPGTLIYLFKLFYFCMICNFLNLMALEFCE